MAAKDKELIGTGEADEVSSTALATIESPFLALTMPVAEMQSILRDTLGVERIGPGDLQRIKIPAGGGKTWEIPTARGPQVTQTLDVVILYTTLQRAYWESQAAARGTPPDCFSLDTIHGSRPEEVTERGQTVFGTCDTCAFARWGSAPPKNGIASNAQACKTTRPIYFLNEIAGWIPQYIMVPPSSIDDMKRYLASMVSENIRTTSVVTRLTLDSITNKGGQTYSLVHAETARQLSEGETQRAAEMARWIRPMLEQSRVEMAQAAPDTGDTVA